MSNLVIAPGPVTVAGAPVSVTGGPWTIPAVQPARVRVAALGLATMAAPDDNWTGKSWTPAT